MRRLAIGEAAGGDPEVEGARLQGGVPARAGRVGSGPANENPGSTLPDALDPAPVTTPDGSRGSELYIQQDEFRHQFAADVSPVKAALTAAGQRTASPGSDRPAAGCRQDSKRGHGPGAVGCRSDVGSCLAWRLSRASWRQRVCGRWEVGGGRRDRTATTGSHGTHRPTPDMSTVQGASEGRDPLQPGRRDAVEPLRRIRPGGLRRRGHLKGPWPAQAGIGDLPPRARDARTGARSLCVRRRQPAAPLVSAAELGFATVYAKDPRQTSAELDDLLGVPGVPGRAGLAGPCQPLRTPWMKRPARSIRSSRDAGDCPRSMKSSCTPASAAARA